MLDFSKTRIGFDRKLSDYSKIRWLVTKFARNKWWPSANIQRGAYLHLGCGPNILEGFVNIDSSWVPGVDRCHDLRRPLPVASGSVAGIYTEHCLEHLPLEDAKFVLAECYRVLMPKSVVRIVVPDLELYARAYVNWLDGRTVMLPNEYFVNRTDIGRPVALVNELFYGSGHRFIYDTQALSTLLHNAGFSDVTKRSLNNGSNKRLLVDSQGHASESLYVEAIKA